MITPVAYYNEHDLFAAAWLQRLMDAGLIAPGVIDTRSIEDVTPNDLRGFTQCHFFAGIGVWSHALRLAGWPDNRPVWTGSCPCQPFSQAGKGAGFDDERNLWPAFQWLIAQCRPGVVFGEQVASKDGMAWIDVVQTDLEGAGYTSGALDLCAAGFGAPHIRQRLYWMAHAHAHGAERNGSGNERAAGRHEHPISSGAGWLGDAAGQRRERQRLQHLTRPKNPETPRAGETGGLEYPGGYGREGWLSGWQDPERQIIDRPIGCDGAAYATLPVNGFWRSADWLGCRDGYFRPVESGTFPLANGIAGRVGRCRAYGNAITAQVAQGFIETYDDFLTDRRRCDAAKALA